MPATSAASQTTVSQTATNHAPVSPPPDSSPDGTDAVFQTLQHTLLPLLPELSLGLVLGVAAGYAVKAMGRWVLLALGLTFIALQTLASLHIITINWLQVEQLSQPWLKDNGQKLLHTLSAVLARDLPFGGSFAVGLLIGLRFR